MRHITTQGISIFVMDEATQSKANQNIPAEQCSMSKTHLMRTQACELASVSVGEKSSK